MTLLVGTEDPLDCPKLPAAIGRLSADAGGKLERLVSARLGSDPGEELGLPPGSTHQLHPVRIFLSII